MGFGAQLGYEHMSTQQKNGHASPLAFFRKQALAAAPYTLNEPANSMRLHQNEGLPWDAKLASACTQKLVEALTSDRPFNLYPNLVPEKLRDAFADYLNIPTQNIEVTSGSSQGLALLAQACFEPGRKVAITSPSFSLFEGYANLYGASVVPVPLAADYSYTYEAVFAPEVLSADVAIFCTPNNPTGGVLPYKWLCEFADRFSGLLVLDEAYFEFAEASGHQSFLTECLLRPNVLVLRTLSKAWAGAGLRVGVMIASQPVLSVFSTLKPPYSIPYPSEVLATWLLQERRADLAERIALTVAEKTRIEAVLVRIPGLELFVSHANFVCFRHARAVELEEYLRTQHSILVRAYSGWRLHNVIRANVWTPEANNRFLQCVEDFFS